MNSIKEKSDVDREIKMRGIVNHNKILLDFMQKNLVVLFGLVIAEEIKSGLYVSTWVSGMAITQKIEADAVNAKSILMRVNCCHVCDHCSLWVKFGMSF